MEFSDEQADAYLKNPFYKTIGLKNLNSDNRSVFQKQYSRRTVDFYDALSRSLIRQYNREAPQKKKRDFNGFDFN